MRHLRALQRKLDAYFAFIASGELLAAYPDAVGKEVVIDLIARLPIPKAGRELLEVASEVAEGLPRAAHLSGRRRHRRAPGRPQLGVAGGPVRPRPPRVARRARPRRSSCRRRGSRSTVSTPPRRSARDCIPARPRWPSGTVAGIEAAAVVDHPQVDAVGHPAHLDADLLRAGVLDDVVQRLLGDPVERLLGVERRAVGEVPLHHDRQADAARQRRAVRPERLDQAVLLDVARAGARRSAPASRPAPRAAGRAARPACPGPATGP